jgi:hypothetical protein
MSDFARRPEAGRNRAEELFCGPITDSSDRIDYQTARNYLAGLEPLRAAAELARCRGAALSLVRLHERYIELIAAALLRLGSLDAEQIYEIVREDLRGAGAAADGARIAECRAGLGEVCA